MNLFVAMHAARIRRVVAVVVAVAGVAFASSGGAFPDVDRHIPSGTLTWKIVYTAHLAQANVKGQHADIAKGHTDAQWTVTGKAHLHGTIATGALDPSGKNVTDSITKPNSAIASVEKAADKCGNNQSCMMAAIKSYGHKQLSVVGREDVWTVHIPGYDTSCQITAVGKETSSWHGRALFDALRAITGTVTVAYSARDDAKGNSTYRCKGYDHQASIKLRADPVSKVYNLTLPAMDVTMSHTRHFTTSKQKQTFPAKTQVDLPAITLKGLPFGAAPHTLHGGRTLHDVGSLASADRTVHLIALVVDTRPSEGDGDTVDRYAAAKPRPTIALDAHVTWTFTPDQG